MKFEDIRHSIKNSLNDYEENKGIKTLNVECLVKKENSALFVANKSDNSRTLFYARKGKRSLEDKWHWFCPSDEEADVLMPLLHEIYHIINDANSKSRRNT